MKAYLEARGRTGGGGGGWRGKTRREVNIFFDANISMPKGTTRRGGWYDNHGFLFEVLSASRVNISIRKSVV